MLTASSSTKVPVSSTSTTSTSSIPSDIELTKSDDLSSDSPRLKKKSDNAKKISQIKNEWSDSIYKMEINLAGLGKLLTELKALLEELNTLLGVKPPTNLNDLIKSFNVAITCNQNLKLQLKKIRNTITDLSLPQAEKNESALEILRKLQKKMELMLNLSNQSTEPIFSSRSENNAESSDEDSYDVSPSPEDVENTYNFLSKNKNSGSSSDTDNSSSSSSIVSSSSSYGNDFFDSSSCNKYQ